MNGRLPEPAPSSPLGTAVDGPPRLLIGMRERRLYVLRPERIEYIESRGNYVTFHADGGEHVSRDSVKRLSDALAGNGFVRIGRSLLLNVAAIIYAQRMERGAYAFTLASGSCLRSGAMYRKEILRVLPLEAGGACASRGRDGTAGFERESAANE